MLTPYECYTHVSLIQVQILINMLEFCVDRLIGAIERAHPYPLSQPGCHKVGHISEFLYEKFQTQDGLQEIKAKVYNYLTSIRKYEDHETKGIAQYFSHMPTAVELNRMGILLYLFNRIIDSLNDIPRGKQDRSLRYEDQALHLLENIYDADFNPREFVSTFFSDLTNGAVINALTGGQVSSVAQLQEYIRKHIINRTEACSQ